MAKADVEHDLPSGDLIRRSEESSKLGTKKERQGPKGKVTGTNQKRQARGGGWPDTDGKKWDWGRRFFKGRFLQGFIFTSEIPWHFPRPEIRRSAQLWRHISTPFQLTRKPPRQKKIFIDFPNPWQNWSIGNDNNLKTDSSRKSSLFEENRYWLIDTEFRRNSS